MSRQTILLVIVALSLAAWGQRKAGPHSTATATTMKSGNGFSVVVDGKPVGIYESMSFANANPGGSNRGTGRRETQKVELVGGPLSPELAKAASTGKMLAEVAIGMCRVDHDSYRVFVLRNVIVSSVQTSSSGDRPKQGLSLVYERLEEKTQTTWPEGCK